MDQSIVEKIYIHSGEKPETAAILADGEEIKYGELWKKILGFSRYLTLQGISKGDRVIVKASHTIDYAVACYGVHACGAVLVPVESNLPPMGVAEMVRNVGASLVVSDTDPEAGVVFTPVRSARETADEFYSEEYEITEFPDGDMNADILFTTGTTGKSKGVLISHKSLTTMARTSIEGTELGPDNVYLVTVPMNHAGGIRKLHMTMYNGSTIVLLNGLMRIKQFFEYIEKYKVTSIYLPPAAVRIVLQFGSEELSRFDGQLHFIYTGSAAYPEGDKEKLCQLLPSVRLYNGYGGSEIGSVSMLNYNKYKGMTGCIGKPNSAVTIAIVDEDRNPVEASPENPGLLAIRSDMNMECYWNEPELTAEAMADGWIYTSDLGYIDDEGFVFLVGRSGDVINIGGLKIAPTEVEEAALRYEGIADCACTTLEKKRGTVLRLLAVMKDGAEFDETAILSLLKEYLEAYKIPKVVEQVEEIPRTFNGKIDRKKLPK